MSLSAGSLITVTGFSHMKSCCNGCCGAKAGKREKQPYAPCANGNGSSPSATLPRSATLYCSLSGTPEPGPKLMNVACSEEFLLILELSGQLSPAMPLSGAKVHKEGFIGLRVKAQGTPEVALKFDSPADVEEWFASLQDAARREVSEQRVSRLDALVRHLLPDNIGGMQHSLMDVMNALSTPPAAFKPEGEAHHEVGASPPVNFKDAYQVANECQKLHKRVHTLEQHAVQLQVHSRRATELEKVVAEQAEKIKLLQAGQGGNDKVIADLHRQVRERDEIIAGTAQTSGAAQPTPREQKNLLRISELDRDVAERDKRIAQLQAALKNSEAQLQRTMLTTDVQEDYDDDQDMRGMP